MSIFVPMTDAEKKMFNLVAQLSHFGWGLAVILVSNLVWGTFLWTFIGWVIYASIKEFWWDEKYETKDIRGSGLVDFIFQVAGSLVGIILVSIT